MSSTPQAPIDLSTQNPVETSGGRKVKYKKTEETEETLEEQKHRFHREKAILYLCIVGVVSIASLCAHSAFLNPSTSADDKKWSFGVLGSFAGSCITYLVKVGI